MKIENIIEDIRADIMAIKNTLTDIFNKEYPHLNFVISLPDIEELTTIKSIVLAVRENNTVYYMGVQIHTGNGNRVFENGLKIFVNDQLVPCSDRHPLQDRLINLVRIIIKAQKGKIKSGCWPGNLYSTAHSHADT